MVNHPGTSNSEICAAHYNSDRTRARTTRDLQDPQDSVRAGQHRAGYRRLRHPVVDGKAARALATRRPRVSISRGVERVPHLRRHVGVADRRSMGPSFADISLTGLRCWLDYGRHASGTLEFSSHCRRPGRVLLGDYLAAAHTRRERPRDVFCNWCAVCRIFWSIGEGGAAGNHLPKLERLASAAARCARTVRSFRSCDSQIFNAPKRAGVGAVEHTGAGVEKTENWVRVRGVCRPRLGSSVRLFRRPPPHGSAQGGSSLRAMRRCDRTPN